MLFLSISKEKTQADIINEQLRKQNASWVATNYSKEIMEIPVNYIVENENSEINEKKFNIYNSKEFFPDKTNLSEKNKAKSTGLLFLTTNTRQSRFQDRISWKEYIHNFQSQESCGGCNAFAIIGALEAYVNKNQNLNLNLSEQYILSYSNFSGCSGTNAEYYLRLISLKNYNPNAETIDNYFKKRIFNEISNEKGLSNIVNPWGVKKLQTKTQISLLAGEVPLGIPLENQVRYLAYDSCEITNARMNLNLFYEIYNYNKSVFDENFCPDDSDNQNIMIPEKRNELTKYFIEGYFPIENSDCKNANSQTISNIKEALKYTPVIANTNKFYNSITNYKEGVWEKLIDENQVETIINNRKYSTVHAIIIVGWGVDTITGKEYWIFKNSWGRNWGEGGYLKTWINDPNLTIECSQLFGFSGELISKSGKEINDLLPIAKQELERQNQAEIQRQENERIRQENLQRKIENMPQPITPVPDYPNDIDPLNEYNIININYQDTKYISDTDCLTIMSCMSNKLNGFYGNNNSENEFT